MDGDGATRDTSPGSGSTQDRLIEMGDWIMVSWALQVVATLGVADTLAAGPRRVDEIATAVRADADALSRVLRLLASHGVVTQGVDGRIALTALGEPLRTGVPGSLRSWFVMNAPIFRALMQEPLESVLSGQPVFERVFGAPFFEYATVDRDWGIAFDAAMSDVTDRTADAVVDVYPFSGVKTIVDVGGGDGTMIGSILRAHPEMRGVLFDLPPVIKRAARRMASSDVADRVETVAGDFFDADLPDADVHLLSWIVHDWDDAAAGRILRNVRRVSRDDGRLLLVEAILPADDRRHFANTLDVVMLVALGGRERTDSQYRTLLREAGFEVVAIHPTTGSMSVIEARPT